MLVRSFEKDRLRVKIYDTRAAMGVEAAKDAAACMKKLLETKRTINVIFAAAPSQNEFLAALAKEPGIDWKRVNAFHMDEYVGLDCDTAPQSFARFLKDAIFDVVPFGSVSLLNGRADPEAEAARYSALLRANPADIVCMGIGENGHIAFNDPGEAEFHDSKLVKTVALDLTCRTQQVHDGCFAALEDVPTHAFTLTIPALMAAKHHFCVVPAPTKASAVYETVNGPVCEACPASILRCAPDATLYCDSDSASRL